MKKQNMISMLKVIGAITLGAVSTVALTSATPQTNGTLKVGVVNMKTCFEGSKLGKQEQARFEEIKKQLESTIEAKEKELNDMAPKFSDEYLDTLSPEAEAELKGKYQKLANELSQQQNQYYNMLNQANYQIVQTVTESVSQAAKKVAAAKGLDLTINEDVCLSHNPSFDISKDVIAIMDTDFAAKEKEAATEKK